MFDIAKRIGRCRYLGGVIGEHMHFAFNKSSFDETSARNRTEGSNYYKLDKVIFESPEMIQKRIDDAEKLKKVMK